MNVKISRHILTPPVLLLPIKFAFFTIGLFIFFVLKMLRPLIKIRVGCLPQYDRIGHLAAITELYLRRCVRNNDTVGERRIFVSGEPANYQLLKMIQRRIVVIKNRSIYRSVLWTHNAISSFIGDSDLWIDFPEIYDSFFFYELNNIPPQLAFTFQEEMRGKQLLKNMGIEQGIPFVCFNVRDKAYLDKMRPTNSPEGWSYHNYRDCDIHNYLPAVKYLASLGIFIIRMGYIVEQTLENDEPRIIDYATRYRTDFGDIYLSAKCKFFLASDGGLSSVPWIFNVPVAYSNAVPAGGAVGWRKPDVFIPKKLWLREKKRFLTFREILSLGADKWGRSHLYEQAGIEVIENTPDEILGLVKEMNARLDGTWITTEEDEELQQRYRTIFPPEHECCGFYSRIGTEFLRHNREFLE